MHPNAKTIVIVGLLLGIGASVALLAKFEGPREKAHSTKAEGIREILADDFIKTQPGTSVHTPEVPRPHTSRVRRLRSDLLAIRTLLLGIDREPSMTVREDLQQVRREISRRWAVPPPPDSRARRSSHSLAEIWIEVDAIAAGSPDWRLRTATAVKLIDSALKEPYRQHGQRVTFFGFK